MSTCVSNRQLDFVDWIVILLIPVVGVFKSVDDNRNEIDPDRLMNGLDSFTSSAERVMLYDFLARYVRKVYPETDINFFLKNNEGLSFIDKITPSDIAFVISVLKNSCVGKATMQSTTPSLIIAVLISFSEPALVVIEPFANTIPAVPVGLNLFKNNCNQSIGW